MQGQVHMTASERHKEMNTVSFFASYRMTGGANGQSVMRGQLGRAERGFTLVELLVVVTILVLLVSGLVTVGNAVRRKAEIRNTEGTIRLLTLALQEYQQYQGKAGASKLFPPSPYGQWLEANPEVPWEELDQDAFEGHLKAALRTIPSVDLIELDNDPCLWQVATNLSDEEAERLRDEAETRPYAEARLSCEVMYVTLGSAESCEAVLNRLADNAVANDDGPDKDGNGKPDGDSIKMLHAAPKALVEVVDAWGQPLRYRTLGEGNFPSIVSAGPDGVFDTADDIISSEL